MQMSMSCNAALLWYVSSVRLHENRSHNGFRRANVLDWLEIAWRDERVHALCLLDASKLIYGTFYNFRCPVEKEKSFPSWAGCLVPNIRRGHLAQ